MHPSIWIRIVLVAFTTLTLFAQTPPSANTGSIAGYVREATTAVPVKGARVFVHIQSANRTVAANTDAFGYFELPGLPSGQYSIMVYHSSQGAPIDQKFANVNAPKATYVEFQVQVAGELAGRVLDDNGHPLQKYGVYLVAREYGNGKLRNLFMSMAVTDEQGQFLFRAVPSGRSYLVLAQKSINEFKPISDAPESIKARERTYFQAYYPNSPQIEAAQPITLDARERREGIEVRVPFSQNYCIAGTVEKDGHPAALPLQIRESEPEVGISEMGSVIVRPSYTTTGSDGKFRICDLHPGAYELAVTNVGISAKMESFYAARSVTITNDDLEDIHIAAGQRMSLSVEAVWDSAPPDTAPPVYAFISVGAQDFVLSMESELGRQHQTTAIPGQISFPNLVMAEYMLRARLDVPGLYVKDISYGSASILYRPFALGAAMKNTPARVTVGRDGGFISARVVDREGEPVPSVNVIVIPANVVDPGVMEAAMISAETDAQGIFASKCLAPGRYHVLATSTKLNITPESISKIVYARSKAQEAIVTSNTTVNVSLSPTPLP